MAIVEPYCERDDGQGQARQSDCKSISVVCGIFKFSQDMFICVILLEKQDNFCNQICQEQQVVSAVWSSGKNNIQNQKQL